MACHHIRMPYGPMAIICGGRRGRRNPERCFYCGGEATLQCDHPVFRQNKKATCDTWMCDGCSNPIGNNLDLCRSHFNLWRNNGNKFVLGGEVLT